MIGDREKSWRSDLACQKNVLAWWQAWEEKPDFLWLLHKCFIHTGSVLLVYFIQTPSGWWRSIRLQFSGCWVLHGLRCFSLEFTYTASFILPYTLHPFHKDKFYFVYKIVQFGFCMHWKLPFILVQNSLFYFSLLTRINNVLWFINPMMILKISYNYSYNIKMNFVPVRKKIQFFSFVLYNYLWIIVPQRSDTFWLFYQRQAITCL